MSKPSGPSLWTALEVTGVLFVATAAFIFFAMRPALRTDYSPFFIALLVPASAALFFFCACVLAPGVLGKGIVRWPMQVVLPLMFLCLILASGTLWQRRGTSLEATHEVLRPLAIWRHPPILALNFATQTLALLALGGLHRPRR